ncbi:hypothetical protein [Vibrio phage phiKT1024]|nr:hypothetical protein [Vibrio phage phiKT1024]
MEKLNIGDIFYNSGDKERDWLQPVLTIKDIIKIDGEPYFLAKESEEYMSTQLLQDFYEKC